MVTDICHDIEAKTAVLRNGLVHSTIQEHNQRLEVRALATGAKPDTWLVVRGSHSLEPIHSQIHPHSGKRILDRVGDAGFAGSRHAVQNDDLPRCLIGY